MNRTFALILAAVMLAAALAGCSAAPAAPAAAKKGLADVPQNAEISPRITLTSSDAANAAAWLTARLGEVPDRVVIGTDADGYGVDVSALEKDGYIIRDLGGEVALFARSAEGLDRAARRYAKCVGSGERVGDETYHEGARIKRIEIAGRDISEYTIYCENETNIIAAANELASRIKKANGASLAVSAAAPAAPYIAMKYAHDGTLSTCGYRWNVTEDGLTLECSDGYRQTSASFAVARFLENAFGWLGLSFGNETLRTADLISLPVGDKGGEVNAFIEMIPGGDWHCIGDRFDHNKNTYYGIKHANHGLQTHKYGGSLSSSQDKDWAWDQPCWLDEDFFEESYNDILAYIEETVAAGGVIGDNFLFVDIAHGDNDAWCGCKQCRKLFLAEGNTHSAHIVTWANRLIEEINKDYPGLYYGIFGYQGTNKPPKTIVPCDQLFITYCYDKSCSAHSLDGKDCTEDPLRNIDITWWEPRDNKTMSGDLLDWLKLTKNVYVWYYGLQNGCAQMSFVHTVRDDIRFFYENGVKGYYWEAHNQGFSTDKVAIWLANELSWNIDMPDAEYDAYYDRILCALYGEDAAPLVREYITIQDRVYQNGRCMTCWQYYGVPSHMSEVMYLSVADELFEIIERAITLAGSNIEEQRLWRLSCENIYKTCANGYFPAYNAGDGERIAELTRRYDLLNERMTALGIDMTAQKFVFVNWDPLRIGYEKDLELEAWTKKDIIYSDFSVTKPTGEMPERVAAMLAEREG